MTAPTNTPAGGRLPLRLRITALRLLTSGPYGLYYLGNGTSLIGTWMQRIACAWLVWDMTHSAFWLGILSAADLMPTIVVGPFAGAWADRIPRLRMTRYCQILLMCFAALTAALLFAGLLTLPILIALVAIQGALAAAAQPARLALVQELVPRNDVGPAIALNAVNFNLARLIGPAIAGVMISHGHIGWVFVANAAVTAAFVVILGILRTNPVPPRIPRGGVLSQIGEGLRYIAQDPPLRAMLLVLFGGDVLARSIWELIPAIAARSFADSASGLAILTSSMAVGAVLGGLTLPARSSTAAQFRRTVGYWLIGAGMTFVFALVTWAPATAVVAACNGFVITRALICNQTFTQIAADDEMRGRVLSIHGLIARGCPSLGALMLGGLSDIFGLGLTITTSATVFAILLALMWPILRRIVATIAEPA